MVVTVSSSLRAQAISEMTADQVEKSSYGHLDRLKYIALACRNRRDGCGNPSA